jgi:hypothetical protein
MIATAKSSYDTQNEAVLADRGIETRILQLSPQDDAQR